MKQTYLGGCQCGHVRYEASMELGEVMSCNCSRCGKLGALFAFIPAGDFALKSGEGGMTEFKFNRHVIDHVFCPVCGIQSFAKGAAPDGSQIVAINARCLDGVDPDTLNIKKIDGRSF